MASAAVAQENLGTILERGHVSEWLVCGPFVPDVDGGIIEALSQSEPVLGSFDFLESMQGVSRARPESGARVIVRDGEVVWRATRVPSERVDLSDLFQDTLQGVAYAAFYCVNSSPATVYMDLQTPLGARVWVNGFLVRDVVAQPFANAGVDRFLAQLNAGQNRVIIEAPFVSLDALGRVLPTAADRERLLRGGFPNRPLLRPGNGFQFALRVLPVRPLGNIVYVPRLRSIGSFSGQPQDVRQGAILTFFNPTAAPSPPIRVRTTVVGVGQGAEQAILPVQPGAQTEAVLQIPSGSAPPGQSVAVEITIATDREQSAFRTAFTPGRTPTAGVVYVLTGGLYDPHEPEDQRTGTRRLLAEMDRQLVLAASEPEYGFYLGDAACWRTYIDSRPAEREALRNLVAQLRCAPHAGYGRLDERIVSGELLVRNLAYGEATARAVLGASGACYYAFGSGGICPQTPQLLAKARSAGTLTDLAVGGIPALFWLVAPDASRMLVRRKLPAPRASSLEILIETVETQRRELLNLGLDVDIVVNRSLTPPPEVFFLGACRGLKQNIPSIRVTGAAGEEFLTEAAQRVRRENLEIASTGRLLTTADVGAVLAQPAIKKAHAEVENLVLIAERCSVAAALAGGEYPVDRIDAAWRQLLFCGAPDRLGFAATPRVYVDSLAAYRDAGHLARTVLDESLAYMAAQVDTSSGASSTNRDLRAIVVFNPQCRPRTDVCTVELTPPPRVGVAIRDETGTAAPCAIEEISSSVAGSRAGRVRVRFVARDVPAMGYRVFYVSLEGMRQKPAGESANTIENEFFRVTLDRVAGGSIISLVHKPTAREFVNGYMNDVVLLKEDGARTAAGRRLWTTGDLFRASENPAEVTVAKTEGVQTAVITASVGGGKVIRELSLYAGIPRIDCRVRLEGIPTGSGLWALTFRTVPVGNIAVYGERFGATVGARSPNGLAFRTRADGLLSASGLQPAFRWAAVSPNDYLEFGRNRTAPLQPALVVYQDGFRDIAENFCEGLARRAIPAHVFPEQPPKKNAFYSDSTEFEDAEEAVREHAGMRVVLGDGKQGLIPKLIEKCSAQNREVFLRNLPNGAVLFMQGSDGAPGGPTLILAGDASSDVSRLVQMVIDNLMLRGRAPFPESAFAAARGTPMADCGVALLFAGTKACSLDSDGELFVGLMHSSDWEGSAEWSIDPAAEHECRYAIYPFFDDWRQADVPGMAQAFNEPLQAAVTDLHVGLLPASQSFLEVFGPSFVVTAVKPAGVTSGASSAGDAIVVRGYETAGQAWKGALRFNTLLFRAEQTDLLERGGVALGTAGKEVAFGAGAFGIETVVAVPTAGMRGPQSHRAAVRHEVPSVHTKHWLHNSGASPPGGIPVSVLLSGDLARSDGVAAQETLPTVTVANNLAGDRIQGEVRLTASDGWNITPGHFEYDLGPGEFETRNIVVLRAGAASETGGLVAETFYGGRKYRDVLELNSPGLELGVERTGREVIAATVNRTAIAAEGYLEIIMVPEYWGELSASGDIGSGSNRVSVSIPAYGEQRHSFRVATELPSWAVVKLAANGHVAYRKVF